jgi:hypothetical protein
MTDESHADAISTQDRHKLSVKTARGPTAFIGTVNGLDAVKRPVVAFSNKVSPGSGVGADQRRQGGQLGVGLLRLGTKWADQ